MTLQSKHTQCWVKDELTAASLRKFRSPPLRSGSWWSWAASDARCTPPQCARHGLCCPECEHSQCYSSSPSLPPLFQAGKQAKRTKEINIEKEIPRIRRENDRETSEGVCWDWPRMKLYCANWAFLIFLFRVQPGSRSTSVMKPLLWNSRWTCNMKQRNSLVHASMF